MRMHDAAFLWLVVLVVVVDVVVDHVVVVVA